MEEIRPTSDAPARPAPADPKGAGPLLRTGAFAIDDVVSGIVEKLVHRHPHVFGDLEAKAIARRIATSPLVKTALFGRDANWGRVLAAAGSAPYNGGYAQLDPDRVTLDLAGVRVVDAGAPQDVEPQLVGAGCTIIDGARQEWEEGDFFVIPPSARHEHANEGSEPAILFSLHDVPLLTALGLYREDE